MTRIILNGCNGKMGRVISACVSEREDCEIVAGIDREPLMTGYFPVFTDMADVPHEADVIIDFSHYTAVIPMLQSAAKRGIPVVVATTGLTAEQTGGVNAAAEKIPVFFSGNMSLGINLLMELVKNAASVLGGAFDIEIIEKHHNQKIDAPSGTALMLAEAAKTGLSEDYELVYERHSKREKRGQNEIGMHSLRGGTIVGEHEVVFAGHDEVISLSHSAGSKEIFAAGAIEAALFIKNKKPGLYNMANLVESAISPK